LLLGGREQVDRRMQRTVGRAAYQPLEAEKRAVGKIHDRLKQRGKIALIQYVLKRFHYKCPVDGMRDRIVAECCSWIKAMLQIGYGALIGKKWYCARQGSLF